MIATVTPSPRLSPKTTWRSSVPNGRTRERRLRAAPTKASLQAGSMRSVTGRSAARASAGPAARSAPPQGPGEERVEPGDRQLHVVGVGGTQLPDPVGQLPERIA